MEIDGLSAESDIFRSQNQSFKDDFDEQLFWLLANNLPTSTIVANNSLILQRLSILFATDLQPLLVKNNIEFVSTHVFGSQANGLALKDSDIDLTILTKTQTKREKTPQVYNAIKKIPESRFLKLGFCQKFTFNLIYLPVMKAELLQISNIQTKKYPTHVQSIDFVINGYDGIRNSMAISHLVKTSKTYHYLVLSLKLWLSQFPRKRRMPLYSYYIMAAHYLQHIVHPALLPTVDLRPFKKESFKEKLLAESNISPFQKIDLTDQQGFSGLSNLLKGFFNYYGIQYQMDDKKPTIFVNQYSSGKPNNIPVERIGQSKSASKPAFNVLDPLTDQLILDLKAIAKKTSFHAQDMEDAYHRLNSNQNIFPQKVMTEKGIDSSKLTKDEPPADAHDDADDDNDELFRVIQKEKNNSRIDLNIFPEKVLFAKAAAEKLAHDNEDNEEFRVAEKKRNTRRINDTLERKLLFQKSNQKQESVDNDSLPKPQQPFFKKQKQPKQFRLADSDPASNQESVSERQQQSKKVQFAKIQVKQFSRILRVLPK